MDRKVPFLYGYVEPIDGVWTPGDEISVTFDEPINCQQPYTFQVKILMSNRGKTPLRPRGPVQFTNDNLLIKCVLDKIHVEFLDPDLSVLHSRQAFLTIDGVEDRNGNRLRYVISQDFETAALQDEQLTIKLTLAIKMGENANQNDAVAAVLGVPVERIDITNAVYDTDRYTLSVTIKPPSKTNSLGIPTPAPVVARRVLEGHGPAKEERPDKKSMMALYQHLGAAHEGLVENVRLHHTPTFRRPRRLTDDNNDLDMTDLFHMLQHKDEVEEADLAMNREGAAPGRPATDKHNHRCPTLELQNKEQALTINSVAKEVLIVFENNNNKRLDKFVDYMQDIVLEYKLQEGRRVDSDSTLFCSTRTRTS